MDLLCVVLKELRTVFTLGSGLFIGVELVRERLDGLAVLVVVLHLHGEEQEQRDHACAARRHGICAARCSVAARDVGFLRCYSGGVRTGFVARRVRSLLRCSVAAPLARCRFSLRRGAADRTWRA